MTYEEFLKGKIDIAEETGIVVEPEAVCSSICGPSGLIRKMAEVLSTQSSAW